MPLANERSSSFRRRLQFGASDSYMTPIWSAYPLCVLPRGRPADGEDITRRYSSKPGVTWTDSSSAGRPTWPGYIPLRIMP